MGFDSKCYFALLRSCWVSFAFGRGVSFFAGIQHSPAGGGSVASCNFGVAGEDECTSYFNHLDVVVWPSVCQRDLFYSSKTINSFFFNLLFEKNQCFWYSEGQGNLGMLQPMGLQRVRCD